MSPRFLLDTHIVVRWLAEPKRLSRQQTRILNDAVRRSVPVALSAVTLLELAVLLSDPNQRIKVGLEELFDELSNNPIFRIVPITIDIAAEVCRLGNSLRDPADRAIVATARIHHLQLLTADQRIIDSKLVSVVE